MGGLTRGSGTTSDEIGDNDREGLSRSTDQICAKSGSLAASIDIREYGGMCLRLR